MNGNNMRLDGHQKNTYRATSNLNTAIENPQINMNSAVDVNIKNVNSVDNTNKIYSSNLSDVGSFSNNQSFENKDFILNENSVSNQSFDVYSSNLDYNRSIDSFSDDSSNWSNNSQGVTEGLVDSQTNNFQGDLTDNNSGSKFISDSFSSNSVVSKDDRVVYEPTMNEKKKHPNEKFKISQEFRVMIFIVFILFIFILVVPYIYDFFKDLQLIVTT